MEYRILGPLEVVRDGASVAITGRHQPRLLAALLLEAGRTVSVSRLVEALWDREPPMTAWRQVRNQMAALRRVLGPDDPVETVASGYRFAVGGNLVDCVRFDELVALARTDLREGRHAHALAGLDAALGLWRGEVLQGLSAPWRESRTRRFTERRLGAIEERAETKLALGRNAEVVDELRAVLGDQPFRQRAAGHLMLALYRCGRGGEALDVFDRLRERLTEEVGIDPNPTLCRLRERISRDDPELALRPGAVEPTSPYPVPGQLPGDVATFTGRAGPLARLDGLPSTGPKVAVVSAISGFGGVGKTALAVHWGQTRKRRFPDGQLYINLRGFDREKPVEPLDALARLARALGVTIPVTHDVVEAAALFRSTLAGRRVLLVLDNARTVEQVRPLLPGSGECTVVVTSRNRLAELDDAELIDLDVLSPAESGELLAELLDAERLSADPEAARRLAELCGHLPLALRIAAANLAGRPDVTLADVVAELDGAGRLDRLRIDEDPNATISAVFGLSIDALEPDARRLLARLGTVPGTDIRGDLAIEVSGCRDVEARGLLRDLVSANLISLTTADRYQFHDLVRIFVSRLAKDTMDDADRAEVTDIVIDWNARNQQQFGVPDIPNVIAACAAYEHHPRVWRVAKAFIAAAEFGVDLGEIDRLTQAALRTAEKHRDTTGQAYMVATLGGIQQVRGRTDSAIDLTRRAVAIADGDVAVETTRRMYNYLGIRLLRGGLLLEAEEWFVKSLRLAEAANDHWPILVLKLNLGNAYRVLGRYADAERHLVEAAALEHHAKNQFPMIGNLIARATIRVDTGRYDEARILADKALGLARDSDAHRHAAFAIYQLGQVEQASGSAERARDLFREAAELMRRHGLPSVEQQGLGLLAELESDQGDQEAALEYLEKMRAVGVEEPTTLMNAEELRLRSLIHTRATNHTEAIGLGREAVRLFASIPFPLRHAQTLTVLADAHTGLGHHSQAAERRRQALAIFTRIGVPEPAALRADSDARPR